MRLFPVIYLFNKISNASISICDIIISWEDCAKKFGIDVHKIQRLFDTPETEQDFRENIKRTAELGIKSSPTILINNHLFPTNQLLRARGTPCE